MFESLSTRITNYYLKVSLKLGRSLNTILTVKIIIWFGIEKLVAIKNQAIAFEESPNAICDVYHIFLSLVKLLSNWYLQIERTVISENKSYKIKSRSQYEIHEVSILTTFKESIKVNQMRELCCWVETYNLILLIKL